MRYPAFEHNGSVLDGRSLIAPSLDKNSRATLLEGNPAIFNKAARLSI